MRKYFSRKTVVLLSVLAIGAVTGGIAYAECETVGGGGGYVPPAPLLSAATAMAGDVVEVTGAALTSLAAYAVLVDQWAYDNVNGVWVNLASVQPQSLQALGPHDWEAIPDSSGNLEPIDVAIPTGFTVGYTYYIYLQSADGEVTDSTPLRITESSPTANGNPCPPDDRGDGVIGPEGGLYGRLNAKGCEKHHMPSKASFRKHSEYSKYCAPAIRMRKTDHDRTASHRNAGAAGKAFRAEETKLIDAGDFRAAFELNVTNKWKTGVQDLFPGEYDAAIEAARAAIDQIPECRRQ